MNAAGESASARKRRSRYSRHSSRVSLRTEGPESTLFLLPNGPRSAASHSSSAAPLKNDVRIQTVPRRGRSTLWRQLQSLARRKASVSRVLRPHISPVDATLVELGNAPEGQAAADEGDEQRAEEHGPRFPAE